MLQWYVWRNLGTGRTYGTRIVGIVAFAAHHVPLKTSVVIMHVTSHTIVQTQTWNVVVSTWVQHIADAVVLKVLARVASLPGDFSCMNGT